MHPEAERVYDDNVELIIHWGTHHQYFNISSLTQTCLFIGTFCLDNTNKTRQKLAIVDFTILEQYIPKDLLKSCT